MNTSKVCILGGSGFVGRHLAEALAERGIQARVLTRAREQARYLIVLPNVDVVEADIHSETELAEQFAGMDAVINLVGVLHDGRGSQSFASAHVELPHKVVNACVKAGVKRLLHMSALKADSGGPSKYLRSKGDGEAVVRDAVSDLAITIFRPSVIFGPDDSFLNRLATLIRFFPVLPLAAAGARFQPVYVEDVARVFVDCLDNTDTYGRSYEVCGPRVYSLRELVQFTAALMHKNRTIISLSPALSRLQAASLEFFPGRPMTRDNLRSMQVDNVCDCDFATQFGFKPASVAAIAPTYLGGSNPRGRYQRFRRNAGR